VDSFIYMVNSEDNFSNGHSSASFLTINRDVTEQTINFEYFDPYHVDSGTDLTTTSEFAKIFWNKTFALLRYVCNPHRQCEECLNLVEGH
jgi:hypothetical protein